jgi:rod shape determining protein RodA
MRLISFINPYIDSKGVGWNSIQSVTAVGSGGFWGKGFLQGTQSQLRYLPQQSTDFIFSIIAEEWGFVGCIFVLFLFLVIFYRSIKILINIKDKYAIIVGAGIIGCFIFIWYKYWYGNRIMPIKFPYYYHMGIIIGQPD